MHRELSKFPSQGPLSRVWCSTNSFSALMQSMDSVRVSTLVMWCCVRGDVRQEALIHDGCVVKTASDELLL